MILDASTLLNLANGEVLSKILSLPGVTFRVSREVRRESRSIAKAINAAVASGHLVLVDDTLISASDFVAAKTTWQLDDGETECILAAGAIGCAVACDDRAARTVVVETLGEQHLSGSVGLLREAVGARLLTSEEAFAAYTLMRQRGGFLPELAESDF